MDVLNDTSRRHFVNIASIIGADNIPFYVKQYNLPDEKQASAFGDAAFADRTHREYSLESPGATWLSAAYLAYNNRGNIPESEISGNIKRAAQVWGIGKDVSRAVRKIREHFEKLAAPREPSDSDYGLVIYDQAGVKKRKYPLFCREDVEKAASYFEDNRRAYPARVRRVLTSNILRKAAEFGVEELPECIFKEAGACLPDREAVIEELGYRADTVRDPEIAALIANTARLVKIADADELFEMMDKVAETIEACDVVEGRVRHYGTKYLFPADVMYGMPYKQAAEKLRHVVVLGNHAFDTEKMASELGPERLEYLLGKGFADAVSVSGAIDPDKLAAGLDKLASVQKSELEALLETMFA